MVVSQRRLLQLSRLRLTPPLARPIRLGMAHKRSSLTLRMDTKATMDQLDLDRPLNTSMDMDSPTKLLPLYLPMRRLGRLPAVFGIKLQTATVKMMVGTTFSSTELFKRILRRQTCFDI